MRNDSCSAGGEPFFVCSPQDLESMPHAVVRLDRGEVCAVEVPGRPGREVLLCLETTFDKDIMDAVTELSARPPSRGAWRSNQMAFRGDTETFVALARKILRHFEGDS